MFRLFQTIIPKDKPNSKFFTMSNQKLRINRR
ncbi:unnamed protein product, partial [Rotaria sp. Silwood2]